MLTMRETKKANIKDCARCGNDHEGLIFKRFVRPIYDKDGTIWHYWTLCPETDEPLLMRGVWESSE